MRFSWNRFYGTWLAASGAFNCGFGLRSPLRIINVIAGVVFFLLAVLLCWEPKVRLAPGPTPQQLMEQLVVTYHGTAGTVVYDEYGWQPMVAVQPAEATGDFSESVRCLERKIVMKPGAGGLKQLWWHCYGGITGEDCAWGGGHWCLVILGESPKEPDEIDTSIQPAGSWTTPLTHLQSFDHDPTEAEKEKITPVMYRHPADERERYEIIPDAGDGQPAITLKDD